MSIKFSFARVTCANQINRFRESKDSQFVLIQLALDGWKAGSRNRLKNFSHPTKAHAYINKLLDGSWISEAEYNLAWTAISDLWNDFVTLEKFLVAKPFSGTRSSQSLKPSQHDAYFSTYKVETDKCV